MKLVLDIQYATQQPGLPAEKMFRAWVEQVLAGGNEDVDLTIRVVDETEGRRLNHDYRGKECATNVLSFPANLPPIVESPLLGDIIICAPVVIREAAELSRDADEHWAHMVVHGLLHLLGYDHQTEEDAKEMEKLERDILTSNGGLKSLIDLTEK